MSNPTALVQKLWNYGNMGSFGLAPSRYAQALSLASRWLKAANGG
jgi:hypothetical protein